MAKIQKGDFIRIAFILKVKETDQIIEVSNEKIAKKHGVFDEKYNYGPRLLVVGNTAMFLERVNEAVIGKDVGSKLKVTVPPEETFGQKDPSKIRILNQRELLAKDIQPQVGKKIKWGDQSGNIRSIKSGRVRVDFNHPLAGKEIVYNIEILEKITNFRKKIEALLEFRMPGSDLSAFEISLEKDEEITIKIPEEVLSKNLYLQFQKIRIVNDLNQAFPDKNGVTFIDHYPFEEEKEEEEEKESEYIRIVISPTLSSFTKIPP
jgi:peptidylprolyl isomerase/FKBP-type peptidyl-prolyl cis-trans isomerase SlyD